MKKLILLLVVVISLFGGEQYAAKGEGVLAWIDLQPGKVTGSVNMQPPCEGVVIDYSVHDSNGKLLQAYHESGNDDWTFEQKVPKRAEKLKLTFLRNEYMKKDTLKYITFNLDS